MTEYSVGITDAAFVAIRNQARYIATERQAPEDAKRWLERIWDSVDSLEHWPRRAAKAQEDDFVAYEVRQLVIGSHLILFMIDDDQRKVWVVGLRHGHRLARPQDLPQDKTSLDEESSEG